MNLAYIILAYVSLMLLSLIDNGRGAAYPSILEHFSMTTAHGGYIFSLASLFGLFTNLTGRFWLPLVGLITGTRISLISMSVGSYLISLAGENHSYKLLLIGACVVGLGLGGLGITMNVLVTEGSTDSRRRQYLSGLHGVYGISSFVAPQLLNLIVHWGGDWISYFKYVSYISIPILIYSFFIHDSHKEIFKSSGRKYPVKITKRILIGFFFSFYVGSEILLSSRLSLYLTRVEGLSLQNANTYLSLFFIALMVGRLIMAFKKTNVESNRLITTGLILTTLIFSLGIFIHPLFLSLTGLSMSYIFPVSMDWLCIRFSKSNHLMVSSVMVSIGLLLSIMHWIFGVVSKEYGVFSAYLMFYFLNIGALVFFLISEKLDIRETV